jgi:hypothetical protein
MTYDARGPTRNDALRMSIEPRWFAYSSGIVGVSSKSMLYLVSTDATRRFARYTYAPLESPESVASNAVLSSIELHGGRGGIFAMRDRALACVVGSTLTVYASERPWLNVAPAPAPPQ